ncbi:hypothetical protein HK105_207357 [Polyrhizophydium stewartii]|uniref:Uncharacterized protein n=1 Tax=Polyrhizophydium stewartii TaxID=2732419 RepID=A0ABR4N0W0_9FUNG
MFFRLLVLLLAALVRVVDIVLDPWIQLPPLLAPLGTDRPPASTCAVDPSGCALSIYHGPACSSQPQGWHERVGLVLQEAVAAAASFHAALAAVAPASQALALVPADRGTAPPAQAARCWPRTPRHSRWAEDSRRAEAPPRDPPLDSDDKISMTASALFVRLRAIMELVGADKELRKVFDALMFNAYVVIFICLLKALLLLFELLSRIFVTVSGWCGKIQADAEAKAEADANVDKPKPSCCMNRANLSEETRRPHLNDKNAKATIPSNSCEAHPGTTTWMHELNVAARPSIFEIAPMNGNNTRPQSLSAAGNQPACSLDEIFGLAGSRNINTDGVSAALINNLAKTTLSVEHLCMDAAQAPSSARRVPDRRVLMRAVISLHTQATLARANAAETSASIPQIDDEINTPLDDDLAESHIGGEVGVTEVAVEQPLVTDNTGVIQAGSTPVSALIVVPALSIAATFVSTIGAEHLLVADGTGVIQAASIPVSALISMAVFNIAAALEDIIDAERLLVADCTSVIQTGTILGSALISAPVLSIAAALKNIIDTERLLVADGTSIILADSIPVSALISMAGFNIAAALEDIIDAERLLVADGTGAIQAWSIPGSALISMAVFNIAAALKNIIDAENLFVADGTGVIQAGCIPTSVPFGASMPSILTALGASTATENKTHAAQVRPPAAIQLIDNVVAMDDSPTLFESKPMIRQIDTIFGENAVDHTPSLAGASTETAMPIATASLCVDQQVSIVADSVTKLSDGKARETVADGEPKHNSLLATRPADVPMVAKQAVQESHAMVSKHGNDGQLDNHGKPDAVKARTMEDATAAMPTVAQHAEHIEFDYADVPMIENEDMELVDGDSTDSDDDSTDSDGDDGDEPRVGALACVLDSPSAIDATHSPKTCVAAEREPCRMPVLSAAVELESNETSTSDAASDPGLKDCHRGKAAPPQFTIPEAKAELEMTPRDEERILATEAIVASEVDASGVPSLPIRASETHKIELVECWSYNDTIKLLRAAIKIFKVKLVKFPTTFSTVVRRRAARSTASHKVFMPRVGGMLFHEAFTLLVGAMSPNNIRNGPNKPQSGSNITGVQTDTSKPSHSPLRRAARHGAGAKFERWLQDPVGFAFDYLRPAFTLLIVGFNPKDADKPAEPLLRDFKEYNDPLARNRLMDVPSDPAFEEAMADAHHEYHEFVACCLARLCVNLLDDPTRPRMPRVFLDGSIRGYFQLAERHQGRTREVEKYLDKLVPTPSTDLKSGETGRAQPDDDDGSRADPGDA